MTKATAKNTAPVETTTAEKAPSKMQKARALYEKVFGPGFDLNGKSQRARFIELAQTEIGLTKAGANTYFQNLSNAARGDKLYKYNTTKKASASNGEGAEEGRAEGGSRKRQPTKAEVKTAETKATATAVDLSKRWQILNAKGTLVNSFSTKAKAEAYAEQGVNLKVVDSKAA